MQYYMLDKNDISDVRGIVNAKEVMRELGITNAQFHKMLRNEETYKGCILIPVETDEDDERKRITSEDDELYQLIGESKSGVRYYITSHLRVVSIYPINKREKEMRVVKKSNARCSVVILDGDGTKYINVFQEAYKAFVGEIKDKHMVICDGDFKIENLKLKKVSEINGDKGKKKVRIGDKIYNSAIECAKENYVSVVYLYKMLEGAKPNKLGVEFA